MSHRWGPEAAGQKPTVAGSARYPELREKFIKLMAQRVSASVAPYADPAKISAWEDPTQGLWPAQRFDPEVQALFPHPDFGLHPAKQWKPGAEARRQAGTERRSPTRGVDQDATLEHPD